MKIVAFNGSARKQGNTALLLNTVLKELENEGFETELVNLGGTAIHGCIGCYKCFQNKDGKCAQSENDINEYVARMREAQAIILGSPTYFADISANMKALIERCGMVSRANGDMLKRKVGAAVVAVRRAGAIHAFNSLNNFFLIGQMIVPGSSYWNIGIGREAGEVKDDTEGIETMKALGRNMGWLLKKMHS